MKKKLNRKALLLTMLMMAAGHVWGTSHNATFYVNGTMVLSDSYEEGTDITFPTTTPSDINDKCFVGWATSPIVGSAETSPELVSSATMGSADATFYAVFADRTAGGITTVADEMTHSSIGVTENSYTVWSDKKFSSTAVYAGKTNGNTTVNPAILMNSNTNTLSGIVSTTSGGRVTQVVVEWKENQSQSTRKVDVYGSNTAYTAVSDLYNNNKRGELLGSISYSSSSAQSLTISNSYAYIGIRSQSDAIYLKKITVYWECEGEASYSGYCTDVTESLTLSPACTDGTNYYGTFSSTHAFVVPSGLTMSAVGVDGEGSLVVTDYAAGDVVKANTGVMVSSTTSGEHTVALSSEAGTEIAGNLLKASGDGLTATQMTNANAAGCRFYRLTMHNGSDLGFWWGAGDGAAFALDAHKAYLAVPEAQAARAGFSFVGDDGTGIVEVQAMSSSDRQHAYDLSGRRASNTTKGISVVGGRKVLRR